MAMGMFHLNKNTVVGLSLSTIILIAGTVWATSAKVSAVVNQVYDNTMILAGVVKSLELSRIDRQISISEEAVRELDRYLQKDPQNELYIDQKATLESKLIKFRAVRECVVAGEVVCE